MPDLRVITPQTTATGAAEEPEIAFSWYDDTVHGVMALAQTVALWLFNTEYGGLGEMVQHRIDYRDIESKVMSAVDNVERVLIKEQNQLQLPAAELLAAIDVERIDVTTDSVTVRLTVTNQAGAIETVVI